MVTSARGIVLALALISGTASAQRCGATCSNGDAVVGLSEQALTAMLPEIERVPKPIRGPRNGLGRWVLKDLILGNEPYDATYFIRSGHVSRIEYLSTANLSRCTQRIPFDTALSELRSQYGESQVHGSFEAEGAYSQSAAFNTQTVDISLHLASSPDSCSTRVVFLKRAQKDGTDL